MENPPPAPVRPPGEAIKTVEPVRSPEKELFNSHFRALHGRILLGGETLNPDNKNISPVTEETLVNGSPQLLNECATNCRKKVATVEKDQLEGEINSRVAKNTLVLKQDLSKIEGFDQAKATRWQATLTKLFRKDIASATEEEVRALFDKYFYSKNKLGNDSDTDLFSEDVLDAFDGDLTMVEENADCIIWYARICGFTQDYSETVFKHQITAKALFDDNPDQLVEELNQKEAENKSSRINNPNSDEDEVLRFIWGNKGKIEITPTEPGSEIEPTKPKVEPTEASEDEKLLKQKAIYEKSRDVLNEFLSNPKTTIKEINEVLTYSGMSEITPEDLKKINTTPDMKRTLIIEMFLGQQKRARESQYRVQIAKDVLSNMSENERQQLDCISDKQEIEREIKRLDQLSQSAKPEGMDDNAYTKFKKEVEEGRQKMAEEMEKLPKEIVEKIEKGEIKPDEILREFDQKIESGLKSHQPEIDAQINALKKQIFQWEGLENKDAELEEKPAEIIEQKPFESGKDYSMEEMFSSIQGQVNKKHRFYVENPPNQLNLTDGEINRLKLIEPFFVNIQEVDGRVAYEVNKRVVPFVFEIGDGGDHPDQRLLNGEAATDGDSGVVGLVAASAENPEKQALLYHNLVDVIILIHEKDPKLLGKWLEAQKKLEKSGVSSLLLLAQFDRDKVNRENLRPEAERLFYFSEDKFKNHPDRRLEDFSPTWQKRIAELKQAASENKLQKHHLRWIELLAHSIDVDGLIGIIKEKAGPNKPASTTPSGEEEKKKPGFARRLLDEVKARIAKRKKDELPS